MSVCDIEKFSPFVVFGASKSGTTWLQKMLDLHPEIRCHFQLPIFPIQGTDLWDMRIIVYNEVKSPFKDVFPDSISEKVYFAKLNYLKSIGFLNKKYVDQVLNNRYEEYVKAEVSKIHRRILATVATQLLCDDPHKKIFGTKSYTDLETLFWVFPNAKLIHILRDGRDVVVSKRFHNFRVGEFYLGDEKSPVLRFFNRFRPTRALIYRLRNKFGVFGRNWFIDKNHRPLFHRYILEKLTNDWKNVVTYIMTYQKKYPENFLTVKYEDLRTETSRELKKILEFLKANASEDVINKIIEQTSFERLKKSSDSFYRKGQSGDWRNYFTEEDVEIFKKISGDLLIQLGYENDYDWGI